MKQIVHSRPYLASMRGVINPAASDRHPYPGRALCPKAPPLSPFLRPYTLAFTLIELLVVMAIISLLAAMLLPVLGKGKASAQSISCVNNLHQIGIAVELYVQDNRNRLPSCAGYLPSQMTNLPPITTTLFPGPATNKIFRCPSDQTLFAAELTSYEWNFWLNDAPYYEPEWATIFTNEARVIVNTLFGGRNDTPILGDGDPVHGARGAQLGKNALYFDGRVARARLQ